MIGKEARVSGILNETAPPGKSTSINGGQRGFRGTILCVLLALSTWLAYWPVSHNTFINYDDQDYLTDNKMVQEGVTWGGIKWAFTTRYAGNWHPLTWISHMLDCQLYGMNAGGHHITNLVLHTANSVLLFLLLNLMTASFWRSALVAALFALHPLHVESVAWASERKDVLSTLFFLLTLWTYGRYATGKLKSGKLKAEIRQESQCRLTSEATSKRRGIFYYLLSLGLFALGLMSKPMLVTVPFVLCLLDYWPLGRIGIGVRRTDGGGQAEEVRDQRSEVGGQGSEDGGRGRIAWLVLEKVPFMLLSAASSVITLIAQRSTVASMQSLPLDARLENVLASYVLYLKKMLWPTGLAPFYPFHDEKPLVLLIVGAVLILGVSTLAFTFIKRIPYLAVGWFWYLGTLIPVIGLVQVGLQSMADRYTYIPSIGVFLITVWGIAQATCQWKNRHIILIPAAIAVVVVCSVLTTMQVRRWKNSETLFRHSLAVTADNAIAHHCLGCVLVEQGKTDEAAEHFAETVRIRPDNYEARNDLGLALVIKGRFEQAIEQYETVLRSHPNFEKTEYNLGRALELSGKRLEALPHYAKAVELNGNVAEARADYARSLGEAGRIEQSIKQFEALLRLRPNDVDAHFNLASLLESQGRTEEALGQYREVLQLKSTDAETHERVGSLLAKSGRLAEAVTHFAEVARLRPDAQAFYNLALAHSAQGEAREAINFYRKAINLKPDWAIALNDLAWILATNPQEGLRNGTDAVTLAERACVITERKEARYLGTLDAAYAETGRFEEAIATAHKAHDLAAASAQTAIARAAEQRLKLYESRTPYRQSN